MIATAVFAILGVWAAAAVIAFGIHLAVSMDRIKRLLLSSIRGSAAAMWIVPAVLLVYEPHPLARTIGLLLGAVTAWLLVSNLAPQNIRQTRSDSETNSRRSFLRQSQMPRYAFSGQTLPAILGAVTLQTGLAAIVPGYPLLAVSLFAIGAGIWASAWIARDAYRPSKPSHPVYSLAAIAVTLILINLLSTNGRTAASPTVEKQVTKLVAPENTIRLPGKELLPGVILRPDSERSRKEQLPPLPFRPSLSVQQPMSFAFSGEYHLFPTSSGHVQSDSAVYRGTPIDAAYINMGGSSMETEALQRFEPPIDCSNCGKILLALLNGEPSPASATLRLLFDRDEQEVGSQIFGFEFKTAETLEYEVPAPMRKQRLTGFRVIFHCNPSRRSQSTKVAIDRFTLLPIG